ncbi:MAG: Gfo/Idh/MocA family oxidoreductase [Clostridiales bacterium]|nr:Gfo/Idh/MocA family oxidoreductase [Clostridiales bacterium]
MSEKIRMGLVGCGKFARNFVSLFKAHPEVESVAVCDLIPERSAEYAAKFDVPVMESFEEMLKSDKINAIAIFIQRHLHGPLVIEALKAGKAVYSAVPCASHVEEIYEIEELVRKNRLCYSMGETGYYRACTIFCREKMRTGEMGDFVYGEAQYNHDQRHFHFENNQVAGIPPMLYPTHSTSMILGALDGVYVKTVAALGFEEKKLPHIFGREGQNLWNNPFSNTAMLCSLSNGGVARISENRRVAWSGPNSYISQFYGSDGAYEFSVTHHYFAHWDKDDPQKLHLDEITEQIIPKGQFEALSDPNLPQRVCNGEWFRHSSPIHNIGRIPEEYRDWPNGHDGTHHFMVDDFCRAFATGKLSPTNIWTAARFNIPGLIANQSALKGGIQLDVPDLGDPPADWEVLRLDGNR